MGRLLEWLLAAGALAGACTHDRAGRSMTAQLDNPPIPPPFVQPTIVAIVNDDGQPLRTRLYEARHPTPAPAVEEKLEQPTETALDDEKVLRIAHVASETAIEQARLAQRRARDPKLREIAREILDDSETANRKGERITELAKLSQQDSSVSIAMRQEWEQNLDQLADKPAQEFDRAFIEGALDRQRELLQVIDRELLPAASRPEVRALVRAIRPDVVKRYGQLRVLQDKMEKEAP
jgi:putative membrane protein